MTLHEAYLKAKSIREKDGLTLLGRCSDYGEFWGFYFVPPTFYSVPPEQRPWGIGDITVNKNTGEIRYFTPVMDLDLAKKRKPIPIEQFERLTRPAAATAKKQKRAAAVATAS